MKKAEENFCGHKVLAPNALKDLEFDRLVVTALDGSNELAQSLTGYGIEEEKIFRITLTQV